MLLVEILAKPVRNLKFLPVKSQWKPLLVIDAAFGEILTTCSKMEWILNYGEEALRPSKRTTPWMLVHKRSTVYYEPLGVVAAIVSWNYRTFRCYSYI